MKLSRREWIRMGAGACLAPLSGGWSVLRAADAPLILTTIPSTGQQVPAVGIGTVDFRGDTASAAMEPLGHIAGMAASIIGGVSTVFAMMLAAPLGLAFDGTIRPLAAGVFGLSALAVLLMLWLHRIEARTN